MNPSQRQLIERLRLQWPHATIEPALESGIAVVRVISDKAVELPTNVSVRVVQRKPEFVTPAKLEDYGPSNGLAQSWTPHGVAKLVWEGLLAEGCRPNQRPEIFDMAAGHGRLVEAVVDLARLTLNDLDPKLTQVLSRRFPAPHRVLTADFRQLMPEQTGLADVVVGSPPWMDAEGDYLPQQYVEMAERLLKPGGLAAFVIPDWFMPHTRLEHRRTLRPTKEALAHAYEWRQLSIVSIYRKR